jgi:hypothetical protein
MLVKAKVIDTEMRTHKEKSVCDVTIKLSDPAEAVVITLWNNSVQKDEHKAFASVAGQEVYIGLRADVFNGKLQYQLNTNVLPQLVKAAPATRSAA